jgi:hypothetical protein
MTKKTYEFENIAWETFFLLLRSIEDILNCPLSVDFMEWIGMEIPYTDFRT